MSDAYLSGALFELDECLEDEPRSYLRPILDYALDRCLRAQEPYEVLDRLSLHAETVELRRYEVPDGETEYAVVRYTQPPNQPHYGLYRVAMDVEGNYRTGDREVAKAEFIALLQGKIDAAVSGKEESEPIGPSE